VSVSLNNGVAIVGQNEMKVAQPMVDMAAVTADHDLTVVVAADKVLVLARLLQSLSSLTILSRGLPR
jgi:hypothetical protein